MGAGSGQLSPQHRQLCPRRAAPALPRLPGLGAAAGASRTRLQFWLRSRQREPPLGLGAMIYHHLIDTSSATLTPFPAAALMTYF